MIGKTTKDQQRIESIKINGGTHLKSFKKENITYDMCRIAVELDGEALYYVPEEYRTKEIYEMACKRTGLMLKNVPSRLIDKQICEYAVASEGLSLEFVPNKYITKDICLIAASNNALAFQRMPEKYLTVEFVAAVIKRNENGINVISSLPKNYKTSFFYLPLVEACPETIWALPKAAHTATICKAAIKAMNYKSTADAIKANPELLSQLHISLYDHDTCQVFVSTSMFEERIKSVQSVREVKDVAKSGYLSITSNHKKLAYSIRHILQWPDIAQHIILQNGLFIAFIEPDSLSASLCTKAIEVSPKSFSFIPDKFKDESLCRLAFDKDVDNIEFIPEEYVTQDMCDKVVNNRLSAYEFLPDRYKTRELTQRIIRDGRLSDIELENVPENVLDKDICLQFFNRKHLYGEGKLSLVPERLRDYDVCLSAVKNQCGNLKYVPEKYKTFELCVAAVKKNVYEFEYVPPQIITKDFCDKAFEDGLIRIKQIPRKCRTSLVCTEVIRHYKFPYGMLMDVPIEVITPEMCELEIEKDPYSYYSYVPDRCITEKILISVAKANPEVLQRKYPDRYKTKEVIERIIKEAPEAREFLKSYL